MGRELRRVPPNWEHPKKQVPNYKTGQMEERYKPLYDRDYASEMKEWIEGHLLWEKGEHPDQKEGGGKGVRYYAEYWGGPPDLEYYRPSWTTEEATWYQVYETVSEGTPVTPPFATQEELIEYLVENGDFWDQKRRKEGSHGMPCAPWTREQAEKFVKGTGFAFSMIMQDGAMSDGIGRKM